MYSIGHHDSPPSLWLAVRLPALPLDALLRGDARREAPAVVIERQRVLQANGGAMEAGVLPDMKLATAQALCEGLRVLERDTGREQRALATLAQRLLHLTPQVCLWPEEALLLEIGGCLKLFRGLTPLLTAARADLLSTGFDHALALGHTPLAALHGTLLPPSRRPGYDPEQPVTAERCLAVLSDLPLAQLRRPAKELDSLARPGFKTLGDLLALPRAALGKRFGKGLLVWLEQLTGERAQPLKPVLPLEQFREQLEFNEPLHSVEALLFPMQRLLGDLMRFLQRRQCEVRALRWRITDINKQQQTLIIRRSKTDNQAQTWLMLSRRQLEQATLSAPALQLSLECGRPMALARGGDDLFPDPDARPDYRELLDKLASLPGLTLSMPQPADSLLPEQAECDRHPQQLKTPTGFAEAPPFQERPLWLVEPPQPLAEKDGVLFLQRQPLDMFYREERIASHWWDKQQLRRYRIARHPAGLCCWIYRDERQKRWFLHGLF